MKDSCPICKEQKDARAKLCSLCYNKSRDGSKEKTIASKRKWRENNREKANIAIRCWTAKNKDRVRKKAREWSRSNKEKENTSNKRYLLKLNLANKNISIRTLRAWSAQVRARDTACLYCGSTFELHAHHILSKSKHPEFALFLNNGITLCESCHITEHKINGDI